MAMVLLITVIASFVLSPSVFAQKKYINFQNSLVQDLDPKDFYSSLSQISLSLDLTGGGPIKSYKVFQKDASGNDVMIANGTSLPTNQLNITVNGVEQIYYGERETNPGHHIYRLPNGKRWEHKGEKTEAIQFIPDDSTIYNGVTTFPGVIPHPSTGKVTYRFGGGQVNAAEYADLRYQPGATDSSGLSDEMSRNDSMAGAAVTHAYSAPSPEKFYPSKVDDNGNLLRTPDMTKKPEITLAQIAKSSIKIINAKPSTTFPNSPPEPFYWGPSRSVPGTGEVKVRRMLTSSLQEDLDYMAEYDPGYNQTTGPFGVDRNYYMIVDTVWQATTYMYSAYVEVEYDLTKPDLIPVDLKHVGPLKLGEPATFNYVFKNISKDITNQSFSILFQDRTTGQTIYKTSFSNAPLNQDITGSFQYTPIRPGTLLVGFFVDSDKNIDEGNTGGEDNNYKPFDFPLDIGIDGDFKILPGNTIKYRDLFELEPIDFKIPNGCTFTGHRYKFSYNSQESLSNVVSSQTEKSSFPYPNGRPFYFDEGLNYISLKIMTSCGETGWIKEKPLRVIADPDNDPPYFKAGWFHNPDRRGKTPPQYVLLNDMVNVRIIYDETSTPPSPSDPNNDLIRYRWDFEGSDNPWIQKVGREIKENYGSGMNEEGYFSIKADTPGNFFVRVTGDDGRGGTLTTSASLTVMEPNPIPVCSAPAEVKENRPVPAGSIHGDKSWSPAGRAIDHSKDVWINKLDKYPNGTLEDVTATVTLQKVTDSSGLESKGISTCTIIVHPDLPPIAKIPVPSVGIRNQKIHIPNQSYSPDGDIVVFMSYKYKYDSNNNGFADDAWQPLTGDMNGFDFNPAKVGKYLFYAYACEDYGKCGDTSSQPEASLTFDVINDAPEVYFAVEGKNQQPDLNPPQTFTASSILARWSLFHVNTNEPISNRSYMWNNKNGILSVGAGKAPERLYSYGNPLTVGTNYRGPYTVWTTFQDFGFGANGISPYKAMDPNTRDTGLTP